MLLNILCYFDTEHILAGGQIFCTAPHCLLPEATTLSSIVISTLMRPFSSPSLESLAALTFSSTAATDHVDQRMTAAVSHDLVGDDSKSPCSTYYDTLYKQNVRQWA